MKQEETNENKKTRGRKNKKDETIREHNRNSLDNRNNKIKTYFFNTFILSNKYS